MTILRAFLKFKGEAALIGRMLAGYADLEIDLMHCVKAVRDDLDAALKTMFRSRGESQRIRVADALGRRPYDALGIGEQFARAIGAVDYCRRIRNQYAHCNWWDDNSERLAYTNLEDLANTNGVVENLKGIDVRYVTVPHLEAQMAYFEYADALLVWVIQEGCAKLGKPHIPHGAAPKHADPPPLHLD